MVRIATGSPLSYNLTDIELAGDPEDIAVIHIESGMTRAEVLIGPPRASSLYSSCIRMHSIAVLEGLKVEERLSIGERITFGIGRAVHYWIQNSSDIFSDNKYGWWKCMSCGDIAGFTNKVTSSCGNCGAKPTAFHYEEHHVTTPEPHPCSGHPDLFMSVATSDKLRVVEIKTISSDQYKKLVMPSIEHQWQLQYYMWACSSSSMPMKIDPLIGYVLYVSKGALWNRVPLKMFPVKRDTDILNQIQNKLKTYHNCVSGETPGYPPVKAKCELKLKRGEPVRGCPLNFQCAREYEATK